MTRTQWMLAAALLLQALLLVLVAAPWASDGGAGGAPRALLPELESFEPARIEIRGDEETLVLAREGERWRVEQVDGFPADRTKVGDLLDDLRGIEVRRPVVSAARYHDALKVAEDDFERRLTLRDAGGTEIGLFIGSSPNYGINHVRRADESAVYEARGVSPWDMRADADSWIDKRLVDVQGEDVSAVRLSNAHGTIALSRRDGAWVADAGTAGERALDPSKVDAFVASIGSLRLSDPAGRTDGGEGRGLGTPAATLELTWDGGQAGAGSVRIVVGAEAEADSGKRYARRDGDAYDVILAKWDAERLLDKKLADLLAQPDASDAAAD